MEDATLARLKRRLGIADTNQDELLNDLLTDTEEEFKLLTGASNVDEKYSFIIRSVVLKRYNRKGSEGMKSESVDGYSVSYDSTTDDFAEFKSYIDQEFGLGKVRFI